MRRRTNQGSRSEIADSENQDASKRRAESCRRCRRALGAGAALAATLLSISAHQVAYYPIDPVITRAVQGVHGAWFHVPLGALSALGFAPLVTVFDCILILFILAIWGRWDAFASGFAALGAPALQYVVKALVARPRPPATLVHVAHHIGNPAFPAGHVLDVTAFLGFVCYLAYVRLAPSLRRAALIVLALAIVALMGLARIDAGEHWASDVLGGYLFGIVWLVVAVEFYAWGRRKRAGQAGSVESKTAGETSRTGQP